MTDDAATYRRLADDAARHQAGRAAFLRDPGLTATLEWRTNRRPNATWADRYAPGFANAIAFLDESRRVSLWKRYSLGSVAVIVPLIVLGASLTFLRKSRLLEATRREGFARQLVYEAQAIERDKPEQLELSALLALASAKLVPTSEDQDFLRSLEALSEKPRFKSAAMPAAVKAVSYSRDGNLLVIVAGETVSVLDTATGRTVQKFDHGAPVAAIAFSPDGKFLATASYAQKAVRLFDVVSGTEIWSGKQNSPMLAIAFSRDGQRISVGSSDKTVKLLDAKTGAEIWNAPLGDSVVEVAFSDDGRFVAAGSQDKTARVFDAASGKQLWQAPPRAAVSALAFSPGSRYLAIGYADGLVRVVDASTGDLNWRMLESDRINALAFDANGKNLAVGSEDMTAREFETSEGRELWRATEDGGVEAISFSPDGRYIATGSLEKTARIFDPHKNLEVWRLTHSDAVGSLDFSPDGQHLATGSDDRNARFFDLAKNSASFDSGNNKVDLAIFAPLVFSPDALLVAILGQTKTDKEFKPNTQVFETATGKKVLRLDAPTPGEQVLRLRSVRTGKRLWPGSRTAPLARSIRRPAKN